MSTFEDKKILKFPESGSIETGWFDTQLPEHAEVREVEGEFDPETGLIRFIKDSIGPYRVTLNAEDTKKALAWQQANYPTFRTVDSVAQLDWEDHHRGKGR
jgi:hypothetical protein